ncbi:hypothetical protein [Streptomyces qinzhouensis]|uniref:DUF308 domain-containing protein n=1 Tax=Streptomyces qinzhouensis TaxID=2599401 RepID=A0A5B8J914_9ACTN|nr:hypothetical protein [Streptomyces qinzhouensis]QDY76361.1 hypothetical protein FQU76_07220 [Streptomyces qinzhouensis]
MAEQHDADREPQPIDEEAAWAAIVAGYGEEPPDPPGAKPFKSVEGLAALEAPVNEKPVPGPARGPAADPVPETAAPEGAGPGDGQDSDDARGSGDGEASGPGDVPRLGSSIVFAPGVGGAGPRDYSVAEAKEDDLDESDEGHFVPPEPPPLPEADVTAKFAWLAVVGGPVLMLIAVLLQWDMTWWLTTLSVGGFLGGFATLVARMADDDEEDEDPGRGAVV